MKILIALRNGFLLVAFFVSFYATCIAFGAGIVAMAHPV